MKDFTSIDRLQDAVVYDADGDKVGNVGQVYLDESTNEPTFVTVRTGLFGMKETFVPLDQASESDDGLRVPYQKDFIKDAPNIDADGPISPDEERRIYEYYEMNHGSTDRDRGEDVALGTTAAGRDRGDAGFSDDPDYPATGGDAQYADTGRHAGRGDVDADDDSVVVRDEKLDVHTERRATGQVRLKKHTYTDTETVEVPVTREEVVLDREPVDADAVGTHGDDEIVVETHEEVPVVDKKVSAEKVSLGKKTVQDTETVSDTVQHEDVDVDRDVHGDDRRNR